MAKTSKNKTKQWRKDAAYINESYGQKHMGRKAKFARQQMSYMVPNAASMLVQKLFSMNDLNVKKEIEDEAVQNND